MSLVRTTEPIAADDETLRRVLSAAHVPSLLVTLAQLTGDLSLLREDVAPTTIFDAEYGGMSQASQSLARDLAFGALRAFRDGGSKPAPPPNREELRRMIDFLTVGQATDAYIPLLLEELAFPANDARAPAWRKDAIDADRPFRVAVVGAGMSGIVAAIRLKQAGVPFVVLEKNADVGGTWLENTYPGARVDSPNHSYSYSFAQKVDWPHYFSTQDVLLDYFQSVADEYGVRDAVRTNTEVISATWDDARTLWTLTLRTSDGSEETLEAQALITAVGQLNRPKLPDIAGVERFEGPSFHSARWNHDVDLDGKRVAIIGTGASGIQFIPVVAERAAHLTVFQRTPPWFHPTPSYYDALPDDLLWLFTHVPHYAQWYRFWQFWTGADGVLPSAQVEDGWPATEESIGTANDDMREAYTAYLREQFADRPDLVEKVIPRYPPSAKRIVLDNGTWARALKRPNVELNVEPIREITAGSIVTDDGVEHPADVIIYGTGFHASKFLLPMKVSGRGGIDLHEQWDGDARAYLGIVAPNFPNFFFMYGPNTNIVIHGSIPYFSECEMDYVMECLRTLLETGRAAMVCRQEPHDAYNERIDDANLRSAWGFSKVNAWYKNAKGRVAQNWPFTLLEFWQQTRAVNPADYEFLDAPPGANQPDLAPSTAR